jgi:hypothetical protein
MMDDLTRRAFAAWFRTENDGMTASVTQPANTSGPVTHQGKTYVVLENVNGILAVYRVRTSGQLKRLKRWPAALEER